MSTGIASGLGATWGWALEGTVGTFTTPTIWVPHIKAEFDFKKKPVDSPALHASKFLQASRRNILSYTVDGSAQVELASKQMGKLFEVMLGSTPVNTNLTGAAYLQTHSPGTMEGLSLSMQKGIPEIPSGTIQAFSYNGVKVTDWTIAVARDGVATLDLTLDGWQEATGTSYTAASDLTGASVPQLFDFSMGSMLVGGAITLNTVTASSTTGTALTGLVSSFSVKGANKLKADRYPLGAQYKAEQVSDGFSAITGEFEVEFANLTDFYNAFSADTTTPVVFSLVSRTQIGATSYYPTVQIALPAVKLEEGTPSEAGPEIITKKVPFTAYMDAGGDPAIQVQYITTDTTV